jgi:hypothetical protein
MVNAGAAFPLDGNRGVPLPESLGHADDDARATPFELGMIAAITDESGLVGAAANAHAQLKLSGLHGSQGVGVGVTPGMGVCLLQMERA